jgi:hypothetical protein
MNKKIFLLAATFLVFAAISFAQVGIGTTTPHASSKLDITSTNSGLLIPRMTTAQRTAITSPATGLQVFDMDNNSFWFYNGIGWIEIATGAATNYWSGFGSYIYNNNPGTVGIGTLSPSSNYKLFVKGNTYTEGNSLAYSSTISGGALEVSSSDLPNQFIRMDGRNIQSIGAASAIVPGTPKDLVLNPFGSNVQIGTGSSALAAKLTFPNRLGEKISLWSNSPTAEYGLGIQSGTLQFYTAGQDKMSFGYGSSANFTATMNYYPGTAQLGINCLPQPGYQLAVNGNIRGKEVVVETGWADFVFDKKYMLPALSEVEKFIGQNKHLPGIPSAQEIQTNGLNVGEVQTKMMQKIEELMLYVIALKKEIEELKNKTGK